MKYDAKNPLKSRAATLVHRENVANKLSPQANMNSRCAKAKLST